MKSTIQSYCILYVRENKAVAIHNATVVRDKNISYDTHYNGEVLAQAVQLAGWLDL